MKKTIILITIAVFLAVGYGFTQDCKGCPAKSKCGVKSAEKKAEKVYVSKTGDKGEKFYHKKDQCDLQDPVAMDLKEAVREGYKPCPRCYPPQKETETEPEEK